jgi:branched-chain amino acid transport system substrate-binding protein
MPDEESQADEDQRHQQEGGLDPVGPEKTARTWQRPSRKATVIIGSIAASVLVLSTIWTLPGIFTPQVTIVAIVPLSGASSYLIEIQDAMTLITEKLNKWGGINGMRVRLVVMDCASSYEVAVEKLLEAEEKYHPLAVVTATRGAATYMSDIAEEKGIVLISVGATGENLTEGKEWTFRYYVAPSGESDNAFRTLQTLNVSSVGILHLDDAYGNTVMNQLSEDFEASGVTVESYGFALNCTEFSESVASVTDNDAVFIVALRHQFQSLFEEMNSSAYSGHILGAVEASIPEIWAVPEAQGCLVSAPIIYNPTASIDTAFLTEFEERYGRPLTHQGAIGSDVMKLIWGLLSDREVSRESLRDLLSAGYIYSGILGIVTVEQGAHNADVAVYSAKIDGGDLVYL